MKRINLKDAASLAGVSFSTFRKHIYEQKVSPLLVGFPTPCARGRRLLWLDEDIYRWLASQSTFPSECSKPLKLAEGDPHAEAEQPERLRRKAGRPTKASLVNHRTGHEL